MTSDTSEYCIPLQNTQTSESYHFQKQWPTKNPYERQHAIWSAFKIRFQTLNNAARSFRNRLPLVCDLAELINPTLHQNSISALHCKPFLTRRDLLFSSSCAGLAVQRGYAVNPSPTICSERSTLREYPRFYGLKTRSRSKLVIQARPSVVFGRVMQ